MNGDIPHNRAYLRGLTNVELVDLLGSESSTGNEMDNRRCIKSVREELLRRLEPASSSTKFTAEIDSDTAFIPPFGTVRVCRGCGCLVAGGPTACRRCAEGKSDAREA